MAILPVYLYSLRPGAESTDASVDLCSRYSVPVAASPARCPGEYILSDPRGCRSYVPPGDSRQCRLSAADRRDHDCIHVRHGFPIEDSDINSINFQVVKVVEDFSSLTSYIVQYSFPYCRRMDSSRYS